MRRWMYILAATIVVLGLVAGVAVWRAAASPHYYSTSVELSVVAYPEPGHAWTAGNNWEDRGLSIAGGTIHASTDGGATWSAQRSTKAWSDPSGIAFADANCGWLVGSLQWAGEVPPRDENALLATTDGGATWHRQSCRTTYLLGGVACASASEAWVVGARVHPSGGVIFATSDGGDHWKRQYVTKAGDLYGISFADAEHGWAVGDGVILATSDGGASWTRQGQLSGYYLRRVASVDGSHVWAIGWNGADRDVILASADGGVTWHAQYVSGDVDPNGRMRLSSIAFTDSAHGWVVGVGGVIMATTDGGKTWKRQRSGTKLDLNDVAFADSDHGIAVGARIEGDDPLAGKLSGSIILRTSDAGTTWTH